jgi:DNA-directed RNA polymerase specialized sigma24 family protein
VKDGLTPDQRALFRTGKKAVERVTRAYAALFPALRLEDIASVTSFEHWRATREYDRALHPNYVVYLTQRLKWASLHFVEKELPAATRVFGVALRTAARSGSVIPGAPAVGAGDVKEDLEEKLHALCDERADVFAGLLYADLGSAEGEDGVHARLDNARYMEVVNRALAKLPDVDRLVWERRYRDEETHEAIAAAFGFSVGTAKRRASDAMAAIRCCLRESGMSDRT